MTADAFFKIAWDPCFGLALPPGYRFPMAKYPQLYARLQAADWLPGTAFFTPGWPDRRLLLQAHDEVYLHALETLSLDRQQERRVGFPLSEALIRREYRLAQATWECAQWALQHRRWAFSCAGGTHHAFRDRGEGFCLLNDIAVAAYGLLQAGLERILVIDLDVHQGNGTAAIFAAEPRVFTFSMHGARNFPLRKERSDCDIALPNGCGDADYLSALDQALNSIFEDFAPQFVFYQAGVDVLASDKLGHLGLSLAGCKARDRRVFERLKAWGLPMVTVMGGGYSPDLELIVAAHYQTFEAACAVWQTSAILSEKQGLHG
ncbi:MAG: histone deacetylase [Candidatus Sericytochromatia bacterium]|nr:histone deacetylase [Candidatus Sericytochromatia bacterium]